MLEIEELSTFILEEGFNFNIDLLKQENIAGLNIYKSAYKNTLVKALESKYPTIKKIVDTNFNFLSLEYIKKNKSIDNNLNNFGDDFSSFIKGFKQLNELPFLTHIAEIDLLLFNKIEESKIQLPQGSLSSWNRINKEDYQRIEFDENKTEVITIKKEKELFYLHSSKQ